MYPREFFTTLWRPETTIDVFVAMSFDPMFERIWSSIYEPAITDAGLRPVRVDMSIASTSVPVEIMDGLVHSRLVIADVTVMPLGALGSGAPNCNVMYELGMAHALRDAPEVLLFASSSPSELPFDLASIRVHFFDPNDAGAARRLVSTTVETALEEIRRVRALRVERTLLLLDHWSLALMQRFGSLEYFPVWRQQPDDWELSTDLWDMQQKLAGEVWDEKKEAALLRLIDLGIVRRNAPPELLADRLGKVNAMLWISKPEEESYTWTEFGRIVLERLCSGTEG